jgi:hypothetical protein
MSAKTSTFFQLRNGSISMFEHLLNKIQRRPCVWVAGYCLLIIFEYFSSGGNISSFAADLYLCAHSGGSGTQKSKSAPPSNQFSSQRRPRKEAGPPTINRRSAFVSSRERTHTHTCFHRIKWQVHTAAASFQRNFS